MSSVPPIRQLLAAFVVMFALVAALGAVSFVETRQLDRSAVELSQEQASTVLLSRDVSEHLWRYRTQVLHLIFDPESEHAPSVRAAMAETETRIDVMLRDANAYVDDGYERQIYSQIVQQWQEVTAGTATLMPSSQVPEATLGDVEARFDALNDTLETWEATASFDIDQSIADTRSLYRMARFLIVAILATVIISGVVILVWIRAILKRYYAASSAALDLTHVETGRARVFARMSERLAFATEEQDMVDAAIVSLQRLLDAPRGDVLLLNPSSDRLIVAGAWGADAPPVGSLAPVERPGLCPGIRRGIAYRTDDASDRLAVHCQAHEIPNGSLLCIPMLAMGEIVGVIHLERPERHGFGAEELELAARVAEQTSMALSGQRLMRKLERQAGTDPLTGLGNARSFDQALDRELAATHSAGQQLSVIMLDLDHFKQINDTHGHPAGDEVLKAFARAVLGCVRESDVVARYGGEEFAVMLRGADLRAGVEIGEHIRLAVAQLAVEVGPARYVRVTASLGVANSINHGVDRAALLRGADQALYQAKENGRNRVVAASCDPGLRERDPAANGMHAIERSTRESDALAIVEPAIA